MHLHSKIKRNMGFIVKNTTLPGLLDLLAPHSCRGCGHIGEALCNRCKNDIILNHINFCPNCKRKTIDGRCSKCKNLPPIFIVNYRNTLIGKLVHDLKYNSVRALAKPLANILHSITPPIKNAIVVPLPTINRHIRERGLDHTYLIAKHFAELHHVRIQKILVRNRAAVQVGSTRKERLSQASSAYSISQKIKIDPNITYILFDDVWTTGASMKAAIKKLRQAGAQKIMVFVLAVS